MTTAFTDDNQTQESGTGKRQHSRRRANVRIGMRKRGYSQTKTDMTDISQTGFQIDSTINLATGEIIFIYLPGIQPLSARVVWRDGFRVGCRFEAPISEYIYERLVDTVGKD